MKTPQSLSIPVNAKSLAEAIAAAEEAQQSFTSAESADSAAQSAAADAKSKADATASAKHDAAVAFDDSLDTLSAACQAAKIPV